VLLFGLAAWLVRGFRLRNGPVSAVLGAVVYALLSTLILRQLQLQLRARPPRKRTILLLRDVLAIRWQRTTTKRTITGLRQKVLLLLLIADLFALPSNTHICDDADRV
jgi:hypothetical protein